MRGGKRPGAGRKPLGKEKLKSVKLQVTHQRAKWLSAAKEILGISGSEATRRALDEKYPI